MPVGSGLSKARHPHHNQARVYRLQLFPTEAPFFHRASPEVLYEHISGLYQFLEKFCTLRRTEIHRYAALVPVRHLEPKPNPIFLMTSNPQHVAARVLHLYNISPEIPEQHSNRRSRNNGRGVNNADPLQCIFLGHSTGSFSERGFYHRETIEIMGLHPIVDRSWRNNSTNVPRCRAASEPQED